MTTSLLSHPVPSQPLTATDGVVGAFYGRFPYPWAPTTFSAVRDPSIQRTLLNQELGDWTNRRVPQRARIWVAGCGTNQAVYTALRFPDAAVQGSDMSSGSLAVCEKTSSGLGLRNLSLKNESINGVTYCEAFDYIICTGVIHHNAQPVRTLDKLARSLSRNGVLELMVYNAYHRGPHTSFQRAVRLLNHDRVGDFETDLHVAQLLRNDVPAGSHLHAFLERHQESPEAEFADMLIHPIEHSYTIFELRDMAAQCGLRLVLPALTEYVKYCSSAISWDLDFKDPELAQRYNAMSDVERWQLANLLLNDRSPWTWFYLEREDCELAPTTQHSAGEGFLASCFHAVDTTQRVFIRDQDGNYREAAREAQFPTTPPEPELASLYGYARTGILMKDALERAGLPSDPVTVNRARVRLTTPAFPYLIANQ